MSCLGFFNPLNAELNPICHLLALLEAHHILHVSKIRGKHVITTCVLDERVVAGLRATVDYECCEEKLAMLHFKPLNAELNPICYLLALLGAHHILHVRKIRGKHVITTCVLDESVVAGLKAAVDYECCEEKLAMLHLNPLNAELNPICYLLALFELTIFSTLAG